MDTTLDQWHARENDFVIVVCTPEYKKKVDKRAGAAGYEGDIMTGEAFVVRNRRKFIPVLRLGEWQDSAPTWLLSSYYVDLRGDNWNDNYKLLTDTLYERLPDLPPVQEQSFVILTTKDVYDNSSGLIWTNCRDENRVEFQDLQGFIDKTSQKTGWSWRLPTENEVDK